MKISVRFEPARMTTLLKSTRVCRKDPVNGVDLLSLANCYIQCDNEMSTNITSETNTNSFKLKGSSDNIILVI